jgi:hypothetical protein
MRPQEGNAGPSNEQEHLTETVTAGHYIWLRQAVHMHAVLCSDCTPHMFLADCCLQTHSSGWSNSCGGKNMYEWEARRARPHPCPLHLWCTSAPLTWSHFIHPQAHRIATVILHRWKQGGSAQSSVGVH